MQREKVIVVGGSGFIGRELCRLTVALGHDVVSISLDGKPDIDADKEPWIEGVDWKKGDIEKDEEWPILEGALSVILCTPPLDTKDFHKKLLEHRIERVVLVQSPSFSEAEYSGYDASYIIVRPFQVVDDETWTMQSMDTIHVSNLGMALLRLGLEEKVPKILAGSELVRFGDVVMIQ